MNFNEIVELYKAALPEGEFYHFPITAMDHTGICSWSSVFLPGPLGGGDGYGLTDTEAEVGTLGELHERLQSLWVVPTLKHEEGTFADLVAAYGEASVINPVTLGLPAGSEYTLQTNRLWVKVKRYPTGEAYAPLEAVASSPAELPPGYRPLFLPVSNGLGAGLDESRALCHGVLELLQRDGNSVTYRALDQGHAVDLSGDIPDDVASILERLKAAGLTVNVKLAASDLGLVSLYVNGYGLDDDDPQIKLAAGGEACDLDRTAALRKALLEFAFSRARLAFSHGPLREAAKVAPEGYFDAHRAHFHSENEEPRALRAMLSWLELAPAELRTKLTRIYETQEIVPWANLPTNPSMVAATPAARLTEIAKRLEGFDIFYLDMATPRAKDHGVVAVKAIVPGLEVETASYGRIGARNLRRLLDREDPLVGIGEPPRGAERVCLTEAATMALGGPSWFHTIKLREVVGDLYTLYREPSRHAAPYVRELG